MGVLTWAAKLFDFLTHPPTITVRGVIRTVLRGIVSAATRLDESLGDIRDTVHSLDPGEEYAEWAEQYRNLKKGSQVEERLVTWGDDTPLDESVLTPYNFRRARKYRYIFSALVNDDKAKTRQWKMFSIYGDELLSPNEIKRIFNEAYLGKNYENNVSVEQLVLKRVHKWIPKE